MLVPPSLILIVYGSWENVSVARLFAAAVMPGVLLVLMLMLAVVLMVKLRAGDRAALGARIVARAHAGAQGHGALAGRDLIIMGSIFGGLMTPTEASGLGAFMALGIAKYYGALSFAMVRDATLTAVKVTAMIAFIIFAARLLSFVFQDLGATAKLSSAVLGLDLGKYGTMFAIVLLYLILGMFFDSMAMMLLTLSFIMPIIIKLGYDPIWWGVTFVLLAEIGLVTPPFGLNLFTIHGVLPKFPVTYIARASLPVPRRDAADDCHPRRFSGARALAAAAAVLNTARFDREVDLLVAGAGAAGMTAALVGALEGLEVLLCEKSGHVGGTSATAAGTVWIPGNTQSRRAGFNDSVEQARLYLDALLEGPEPRALRDAFLSTGPEAIDYLEARSEVKFVPTGRHPDYRQLPGAAVAGRGLIPESFDGRLLKGDFRLVRPPIEEFMVLGGMMIAKVDIAPLVGRFKSLSNFMHAARLGLRYALDRLRYPRGTRLTMGNALVARLFCSLRRNAVPVELNASIDELLFENDAVIGARIRHAGGAMRVRARKGVVLSTGGFGRNPAMRAAFMTSPVPRAFHGQRGQHRRRTGACTSRRRHGEAPACRGALDTSLGDAAPRRHARTLSAFPLRSRQARPDRGERGRAPLRQRRLFVPRLR